MNAQKYSIEQILKEKGVYVGPTSGYSMYPMLKDRRDTIIVRPKTERLKPLDVALYRSGEKYVLHRVLEVVDDGYIIRGDNCYVDEHILEDDVFGVLVEFYRKNKHIACTDKKYLRYAQKRVATYKQRKARIIRNRKLKNAIKKFLRCFGYGKNKKSEKN